MARKRRSSGKPNRRKVAIFAGMPSYPKDLPPDVELWTINTTYLQLRKLNYARPIDRIYFLDSLDQMKIDAAYWSADFVRDVNTIGCPVFCRTPYPELKNSKAYPIKEMLAEFHFPYWVCSVAYAITHAISERRPTIYLAGMYHALDSLEYLQHVGCINYWVGLALGRGIEVGIQQKCAIARPMVWQSCFYGYEENQLSHYSSDAIKAIYQMAHDLPRKFHRSEDFHNLGLENPQTEHYFKDKADANQDSNRGRGEGPRQEDAGQARPADRAQKPVPSCA
jgi:hypothetical protein